MIETKNVVEVVSRVVNTIEEAEERIRFALNELKELKTDLTWAVRREKASKNASVPFDNSVLKSAMVVDGYTKTPGFKDREVFTKEGGEDMDENQNPDTLMVSFFKSKKSVSILYNHNGIRLDVTTVIKSVAHFNQMLEMVGLYGKYAVPES